MELETGFEHFKMSQQNNRNPLPPPVRPKHVSPYKHAPKIFGLKFKIASRVMLLFEAILGKLMLVLAICSIIYAPNWYPVIINFLFLSFVIFSIVTYNMGLNRKCSIFAYPMLSYELVTIFWSFLWLYAALNAVATGYMWWLEWLGGPITNRIPTSHDIKDSNYANPNETHPETARAIKYGSIIAGACVVIISLKLLAFVVARRTFFQIRHMEIAALEDKIEVNNTSCETGSEISNIGGTSPTYPVAIRNRPPKLRMAPLEEAQVERDTPQPSPVPAPRRTFRNSADPPRTESAIQYQYSPLPKYEESSF